MKIGITGHQDLGSENIKNWMYDQIKEEIRRLKSVDMAYSCLAIGADQLFAKIVVEQNIPFTAVIPCKNYLDTFKGPFVNDYHHFLDISVKIDKLDFADCTEHAFLEGGKYIADKSDIIFAIWDGKKAKGLGGTGDIFEYAISIGRKVIHLHSISKSIIVYNSK